MSMICWTCGSVLAFRNVAQPATSWFHGLRSAAASATLSPTFLVNLLEHGPEEPLLAAKVVIEGALCHAGPAGHLGRADPRVAVAGEQLPGLGEQGAHRLLALLCLGAGGDLGIVDIAPQIGVLLGFAPVLLALASWRLRKAITG